MVRPRAVLDRHEGRREYRDSVEDLAAAASEVRDLLPELVALIPAAETALDSGTGSHGARVAAPIPWNDAAALAYFTIHGDARRYESLLTLRLYGRTQYRAGTDEETVAILERLPQLIRYGRDVGLPDLDLDDVTRDLLAWPRQLRVLLGCTRPGDESTTPVPGRPSCPECGTTLVLSAGWRVLEQDSVQAMCRRCRGEDGRLLSWPVTEWVGHLQHDELVTALDAVARYGVKHSTLRSWRSRNRLHQYGEDEQGRQMYRVRDILRLRDGATATDDEAAVDTPTASADDSPSVEHGAALLAGRVYAGTTDEP
ncbi:hypothetical protein [Cellulomonas iranensis]|uniref:hypothetical protein n=1 Tax=Cellulomonas iranensis TaxID=76862 RepID=UPI0013D20CFE|nr:hypothetical protein [Cellulomonas iranensis]